jgi:hypothetical protein
VASHCQPVFACQNTEPLKDSYEEYKHAAERVRALQQQLGRAASPEAVGHVFVGVNVTKNESPKNV